MLPQWAKGRARARGIFGYSAAQVKRQRSADRLFVFVAEFVECYLGFGFAANLVPVVIPELGEGVCVSVAVLIYAWACPGINLRFALAVGFRLRIRQSIIGIRIGIIMCRIFIRGY